ncbi:MAG: glutathione S-transferase family protein [Chromatiales bacterium]|nr:glutathione S-transferase family protein [Chromatiales bacterium]
MTDIIIYGPPESTYVRTTRMLCVEKSAPYELQPVEFESPEHLALHPFARVPACRYGDLLMYETSAICLHLNRRVAGPNFVPERDYEEMLMHRWISAINDYYYQTMIREIVLPRFGVTEVDESVIRRAADEVVNQLKVADDAVTEANYLTGKEISLADLFLAPILFWLEMVPEGQGKLSEYPSLKRWYDDMSARESFTTTAPPIPG